MSQPTRRAFALPLLCLLLFPTLALPSNSSAASVGSAWGAPVGVEPCGSQILLDSLLARDPGAAARRERAERLVQEIIAKGLIPSREARPNGTAATIVYRIPVVVHIVHQGGLEDISDAQVQSQIAAVNRDCQNLVNKGNPAVDCQLEFCLATNFPQGNNGTWPGTPGITRTNSPQTIHIFGSAGSEIALKAIDYFPSDKYLNVWVVKQMNNSNGSFSGVVGYANFPGGTQTLDGIVMDYRVMGSNSFGFYPSLLTSNADGKVFSHEVGHWLNLWHPFQGGCNGGDMVADTPPEAQNNSGCPSSAPISCGNTGDCIENFMEYTNDACRWAFTAGQKARMHAAIVAFRQFLVSPTNLVNSGCSPGFFAAIQLSTTQACTSQVVTCTTNANSNYTYFWQFSGGTPATANTAVATTQFSTVGAHTVTLTVTDTNNNISSTNSTVVYVTACAQVKSACSNWVWTRYCRLDFSSGAPVAVIGTVNIGQESSGQMSDANGNLLFYSNNDVVWDANSNVMPNGTGLIGGTSSHNGSLVGPRPGFPGQYYLFQVHEWEAGPWAVPVRMTTVDMSLNGGLGDVVTSAKNVAIALPGSPNRLMEAMTLIPRCNSSDWWLITHGAETTFGSNLYVTLITSAGAASTVMYPIGIGGTGTNYSAWGAITASGDGSRVAVCQAKDHIIKVYDFDRSTGIPTVAATTGNIGANHDLAFSPNGKLLYFCYYDGTSDYGLKQIEIATQQIRTLSYPGPEKDVELGPDGKVYVGPSSSGYLSCVNFPDNLNLSTNSLNECGYNPVAVFLNGGMTTPYATLPNTLPMCSNAALPAQFSFTITNCTTVNFTSPTCGTSWIWNFGDNSGGSGKSTSHTYTQRGTFSVTLTVAGASPPTLTLPVTIGTPGLVLVGPSAPCQNPVNYSIIGPATYTYAWTITGGQPANATGSNVFITWTGSGGTIQVLATDPKTGCDTTLFKGVEGCTKCTKPPLDMVAWWPLDETSGHISQDIVAGNDGLDIFGPAKVFGKVQGARQFVASGSQFIRVSDAPKLNFGTGDLSVDAWIRCPTTGNNYQGIVDKRALNPDRGYAFYTKQGYLALQLSDGSGATEYWSNTTPFLKDGIWHHVAATVDRANTASGVQLYVDGAAVASFPGYSATSNLNNAERLVIGAMQPWAAPTSFFSGTIDEVELFNRALGSDEIGKIFGAGPAGKCKEYCQVPWDEAICQSGTDLNVVMQICNFGATQQLYNLNFQGLNNGFQGAAGGCSWNGPTQFQVIGPQPPIPVAAGACAQVTVNITRPLNMPPGNTACYQVTITNTSSGEQHTCVGSIWGATTVCPGHQGPRFQAIGLGEVATIQFLVANPTPAFLSVPMRVETMPSDMDPTEPPNVISLNGLPPGTPWVANYLMAPGESTTVEVSAAFTRRMPFRFYDVILAVDGDNDGHDDAQTSVGLRYAEHSSVVIGGPPPAVAPRFALGQVSPNPFRRSASVEFDLPARTRVRMALYDVGGRRVRALVDGMREAGHHSYALEADRLSSGVYLLRLEAAGQSATRRVVLMR